jgi:replicative DNA helicase
MENHEADLGVMTGLIELDDMTSGGMHPAELVILAARPSMGKTALATNIAEHVAVEGRHTTLFVSLEMANLELAQRMLCGRGRIDGQKLRKNFLSNEDYERLQHAAAELGEAPLYIDDTPSRNINEIAAVARRLKRQTGNLGLVVIDYLQLIEPDDPRDPRQEQVSKIARRLKGMARELEVPVLCLAQLNRQAEATKDNIPRLSHLRESGAIEQDADVVVFIHREEYYHSPDDVEQKGIGGKAQIIVAKQRNGPTGHIEVAWLRNYMKFENLSTRHDEFAQFED